MYTNTCPASTANGYIKFLLRFVSKITSGNSVDNYGNKKVK